jgi:hypothetical protein
VTHINTWNQWYMCVCMCMCVYVIDISIYSCIKTTGFRFLYILRLFWNQVLHFFKFLIFLKVA